MLVMVVAVLTDCVASLEPDVFLATFRYHQFIRFD